jgi:hypothetical protein
VHSPLDAHREYRLKQLPVANMAYLRPNVPRLLRWYLQKTVATIRLITVTLVPKATLRVRREETLATPRAVRQTKVKFRAFVDHMEHQAIAKRSSDVSHEALRLTGPAMCSYGDLSGQHENVMS